MISDTLDKNAVGPSEPANMKVTEGLNLQQAFFNKTARMPNKPHVDRSTLVEPIFVNKRSSGLRFQNFIQTFKFSNAHEGQISCIA